MASAVDRTKMQGATAPPAAAAFWAPRAWVDGRWQDSVLLRAGQDGNWASVQPGAAAPAEASILQGPALPGLVNGHSHAFQRAFAGMAERRELDQDDFWSWRDRMYAVALRVTPQQQRAIAAQLFLELLRGGYTHVCEFHYLHNASDGRPYPGDPLCMARAIGEAAREVGIGLTLLPCLYERAGFDQLGLREDQRRFRADARTVLAMRDEFRAVAAGAGVPAPATVVGLAIHSLRAAAPEAIGQLLAASDRAPIHIHIAEQWREVDECIAATGLRPIEWLCRHCAPDARWQLVHATHSTAQEISQLADCGAGVVLCPSTEANLGDGITDLAAWLRGGVPLCLGTDSHVARSAMEELRLLETVQRLARRTRCIGAAPQQGQDSTAARLFSRVLQGAAGAAGLPGWGLAQGARADLLVIDTASPPLLGIPPEQMLDALVFSSPGRPFRDVLVAGRWVTQDHRSSVADGVGERFVEAMRQIWQEARAG